MIDAVYSIEEERPAKLVTRRIGEEPEVERDPWASMSLTLKLRYTDRHKHLAKKLHEVLVEILEAASKGSDICGECGHGFRQHHQHCSKYQGHGKES